MPQASKIRCDAPSEGSPSSLRPGERIINGIVYCYDLEALNDWLAIEAKLDAPDDLRALTDDALTALLYAGIRIGAMSKGSDRELSVRCQVERDRRTVAAAQREAA